MKNYLIAILFVIGCAGKVRTPVVHAEIKHTDTTFHYDQSWMEIAYLTHMADSLRVACHGDGFGTWDNPQATIDSLKHLTDSLRKQCKCGGFREW